MRLYGPPTTRTGGWTGWTSPTRSKIPPTRSPVHGSATEEVQYDLIAGGVDLCASSREGWWEVRGCVGGEVGSLRGEGVHLPRAHSGSFLWGAIVPEGVALAHPRRQIWAPFVAVGAVLPLNRRDFVLTNEGFVHRPAALSLRIGLGIELEFR